MFDNRTKKWRIRFFFILHKIEITQASNKYIAHEFDNL